RNGQVPVIHLKLTDPLTQRPFFPDLFLSDEWQFVTEGKNYTHCVLVD
ncbi:MAG: hypothetical protein EZS28_046902, partial [Streblomastix strix]